MTSSENPGDGATTFRLSKWYLDCVAENGDGAVIYAAGLRWRGWRLHYASMMLFLDGEVTTKSSIRTCAMPESTDARISVRLPHLELEGSWTPCAAAITRTVFALDQEKVMWSCLQPASDVKLTLRKSREISGLGYAERLDMSVAPWKLPLEELHWGRFVGKRNHVVWIDWRGSHSFRLLVHNGRTCDSGSISENEISNGVHLHLTFDRGLVLRAGTLGKTVLPTLAQFSKVLPGSLLSVQECKWRSRSVLITDRDKEEGWSIHEVVRWRQ